MSAREVDDRQCWGCQKPIRLGSDKNHLDFGEWSNIPIYTLCTECLCKTLDFIQMLRPALPGVH
jgi:hypothetical protein